MASFPLTNHFNVFFGKLNPSVRFEREAAKEHHDIRALIEATGGPASVLSPVCFLQGSYKQQTAIYSINDVDIVVLCNLRSPGNGTGRSWSRDEIFQTIAAPLLQSTKYMDKVEYNSGSMCIKVNLPIKVEILPVVYKAGNNDANKEPFRLFRPEKRIWEDGYARQHQQLLSEKNKRTDGNFIPMIKVMKHLRDQFNLDAVSFHIECLMYAIGDSAYNGGPADYIPKTLRGIASVTAEEIFSRAIMTPCRERLLFSPEEWSLESWKVFHNAVCVWSDTADAFDRMDTQANAVKLWRILLGDEFYPL